jgi:tetratricopeptide (TPR) repeat protein
VDLGAEIAAGYSAFANGRNQDAAESAQRVLRRSPNDPAALTLVGRLALVAGEPEVAQKIFIRMVADHPGVAASWLDFATALRDLGRHRDAAEAAERALAIDAANAAGWIKLGEIALSLHERERASRAFRRALEVAPDNVAALRGISTAEDPVPEDVVARMESLCRSPEIAARPLAELHYTLAQIRRRAGRDEEFVEYLLAANAGQRALCADGVNEYRAQFDRLEACFTKDAFARAARAQELAPVPIFILGMPRSGTTLVEQIVAAHPEVRAGGELDYMRGPLRRAVERETGKPFPAGFETLSSERLSGISSAYARRLQLVADGRRFVTDKTPGNFHLLGLLRLLFPSCKIVHVARDPMDTCFSILQYPFDDRSPHTCDMELLAYVYARYRKLMRRWHELFEHDFVTVEYERLVDSPADEARRVFEHCGLEWDDSFLNFHSANAPVRTFSAAQVRRPVYKSSVGGWRAYAEALAPLEKALRSALGGTETH